MKLEVKYAISQYLQAKIELKDSMLGDFTKDISDMAKGLATFAFDSLIGEEYEVATDETKNIANPENYFPKKADLTFGKAFFTNPTSDHEQLAASIWIYNIALHVIRKVYDHPTWNFSPVHVINFWLFGTR